MSSALPLVSELEWDIPTLLNLRFVAVAVLSLTIYDIILRFNDEIEFIWKHRISFLKALYLWQRYAGLLTILIITTGVLSSQVTMGFCNAWFIFVRWGSPVLIMTTEIAVFLWMWALYNHNRRLFQALGLLVFVEFSLVFILLSKYHVSFQLLKTVISGHSEAMCITFGTSLGIACVWIVFMFNACVVHGLIILRRQQIWASISTPHLMDGLTRSQNAVGKLCTRSLLLIIPINLFDFICAMIWLWTLGRPRANNQTNAFESSNLFIYLMVAVCCNVICSTRLLLDILATYYREVRPPIDIIKESRRRALAFDSPTSVIYVEDTDVEHHVWAYELRQIKFSGF